MVRSSPFKILNHMFNHIQNRVQTKNLKREWVGIGICCGHFMISKAIYEAFYNLMVGTEVIFQLTKDFCQLKVILGKMGGGGVKQGLHLASLFVLQYLS